MSAPKCRFATHAMVWMSRRPPGPVFTLGSRLYAVSLNLRWRRSVRCTLASKNSFTGQMRSGPSAVRMRASRSALPLSRRGFEQRGHHANVGGAFLRAFLDRAHAVADFEPDVPQERDELLDTPAAFRVERRRHEQQQIDIRAGVQLAAPVAADGDERPHRAARSNFSWHTSRSTASMSCARACTSVSTDSSAKKRAFRSSWA